MEKERPPEHAYLDALRAEYAPRYKTAVFDELLKAPHLLIAGATGSGKSVLINGLIATAERLKTPPSYLLIDPKKVELYPFRKSAGLWQYVDDPLDALDALNGAVKLMDYRFSEMREKGLKMYDGKPLYIVVDEFAALVDMCKKVNEPLSRLAILARAARISLVLCTQRPTREVLNGCIAVNMDYRVALKTATAQDSRNIIGIKGAESLTIGKGIYRHGAYIDNITIPLTDESDAAAAMYARQHGLVNHD